MSEVPQCAKKQQQKKTTNKLVSAKIVEIL